MFRSILAALSGWGNSQPRLRTFLYKYPVYPFDEVGSRFCIQAVDQEAADVLATERFTELFNGGYTIMTMFFRVTA